jgi:hypothetical protein
VVVIAGPTTYRSRLITAQNRVTMKPTSMPQQAVRLQRAEFEEP